MLWCANVNVPLKASSNQDGTGLLANWWRMQEAGLQGSVLVITDSKVAVYCAGGRTSLRLQFDPVKVSFPQVRRRRISAMSNPAIPNSRSTDWSGNPLVALGGRVVGIWRFVLATYLRDCRSSGPNTFWPGGQLVGGKVGVNLKAGKNLVAPSSAPAGFLRLNTLKTLPERELRPEWLSHQYGVIRDRSCCVAGASMSRLRRGYVPRRGGLLRHVRLRRKWCQG